jgi:hypothetical protein
VIFSRKGFDSASGGCPSPVFSDQTMLALPIPDARSPVRFQELEWRGRNLGDLVERLTKNKVVRGHGAHLDPDLLPSFRTRPASWRPLFGQCGAAQGHLRNQGVAAGDLFLFWGLFRRLDQNLEWVGRPFHAIWGWMQVGDVVAVDLAARADPRWAWTSGHPHLAFAPDRTNTLYAAAGTLSVEGSRCPLPGAGVFETLGSPLVLTAPAAERPTQWSLPTWFLPGGRRALTYHSSSARWTKVGGRVLLQAASRGQEFVLDADEYPEVMDWVFNLIDQQRPVRRR